MLKIPYNLSVFLLLLLLFLTRSLWESAAPLLGLLGLPAIGWLLGQFNHEIENHILLHSIQLVTLFATLLLLIYASELAGTVGALFFFCTVPPTFYFGLKRSDR